MVLFRSAVTTANPVLGAALRDVQASLLQLAQGERFAPLLTEVYGVSGAAVAELRQHLINGTDLGLSVVALEASDLGGALAGYSPGGLTSSGLTSSGASGKPTVFLNADLLRDDSNPSLLRRVLLEEIGHHFDQLLNNSRDTAGDEGQLFASRVLGDVLSAEQLAAIRAENDTGVVRLGDTLLTVENAAASIVAAAGAYNRTASRMDYSVGLNNVAGQGADLLIAAYSADDVLIGWQVVNRASALQNTRFTGSFDFAHPSVNRVNASSSIRLRAWQGTAGSNFGIGNDALPVVTYGTANLTNGVGGFRINTTTSPNTSTGAVVFSGASLTGGSFSVLFTAVSVDTLAPSTPTIDPIGADNTINAAEQSEGVVISGSAEPGSTIRLTAAAGFSATATTASTGSWSIALSSAALESFGQGAQTITAIASDAAGNLSSSNSRTIHLDTLAPVAPTLVLLTDTGSDNTDGLSREGAMRVVGLELTASWEYSLNGGESWQPGSGNSFILPAADQTYATGTIQVRQTDAAGNRGGTSFNASAIRIDTTAAAAPRINAIGGADNTVNSTENDGLDISGVAEAGGTVSLTSTSGFTTSTTVDSEGYWTISIANYNSSFGEGLETITVIARDAAGNVSSPSSTSFSVDTTGPATPLFALISDTGSSKLDRITSNGTVKVSRLEAGGSWEYSTDNGETWNEGSGNSFILEEGNYAVNAVQVRQRDAAGNASSVASNGFAYAIDASGPDAPTINPIGTDNIVNTFEYADLQISGKAEAGSTVIITSASGYKTTTTAGANNEWQISIADARSSFGQGSETITVIARDAAGNLSTPSSRSFSVDTTGPAVPQFTLVSDTGSSNTDKISNNGTIKVSKLETGASWEYRTSSDGEWQQGSGSTFTLEPGVYPEGAIQVRQTDAAGNSSAVTSNSTAFTIDAAALDAPTITPIGADNVVNASENSNLVISGTAEANAQIAITGSSGYKGFTTANGAGDWSITVANPQTSFGEGTETITVVSRDLAGNLSAPSSRSFRIDTTAPSALGFALVSDTGAQANDAVTNLGTIHVTGLDADTTW
ncbi:MAG: hypothetical protein RLZZ611_388, partial [Cyanobacteriota bacterium]